VRFNFEFVKEEMMRASTCLFIIALLGYTLLAASNIATAQLPCLSKASIDYNDFWGPYYNACDKEMKTTFEFTLGWDGSPRAWCEVDNTDFRRDYDQQDSPIVEWTHCETLTNHRLLISLQPTIGEYGFIHPMKLTAEYFASSPY
jgi:hypothetical protein